MEHSFGARPNEWMDTMIYLDGANLKSHDQGHMDKVVMKLINSDRFTSQWTWYQDDKETCMEEIEHRRAKSGEVR